MADTSIAFSEGADGQQALPIQPTGKDLRLDRDKLLATVPALPSTKGGANTETAGD